MKDFIKIYWFQIIVAIGVLWGFYKDWQKSRDMHLLKTNCIKTIEEKLDNHIVNFKEHKDEIWIKIDELQKETAQQGERIARLEG